MILVLAICMMHDVVITYMDGHKKFVQVKHTRANDTLTFGDLVTIDTSNVDANSHISLLGELAKSWNEEHSKYSTTDILLFSNRKKGKRILSCVYFNIKQIDKLRGGFTIRAIF